MTDRGPEPPGPDFLTLGRWQRLESLVDAVLDAPVERRATLIAELSGGDTTVSAELARLVAECEQPRPLLDQPASERFAALAAEAFDEEPPVPDVLGDRYRIVRELGRGGMATVYLARDQKHQRDVAAKVILPNVAAAVGRTRFLREIEIVARLRHPHIVPLYDSGEAGDLLYYVMPYEAGHSLRERLAREDALPVADVVAVLRDVCDALAHAHEHGVVHRDIKPDNVLMSGGHAMVTDFGVARALTAASEPATRLTAGVVLGTPAYMAPEQIAGNADADHRMDIYSVGVLAYELLAGKQPFTGSGPLQILTAQLTASPPPLSSHRADVPDELAALVMKCLEKEPAARWQSAAELLAQLVRVGISRDDAARGASVAPRVGAWRSVAAAGVLVAAVLLASVALRARGRVEPAPLVLGRASQLTADAGLEVQPTFSPDGRYVAYATGTSSRMRILVRPVAGGRTIALTNDTTENEWFPRWSPDGARILYLTRNGVFSAPALGGPPRQEIPGRPDALVTSAVWSSNGRELAFTRGDSLFVRTVATGEVRAIASGADLHSCAWSPDDSTLACVSGNSFYVTVGALPGLGPMFGNLAPSSIVLVPATGGTPTRITGGSSIHQSPVWSRDGRTLYYVSNRHGPRDVYAIAVGRRRPTGDEQPVRITTGLGAHSVAFSSDDNRLVYGVYASSANVWALPIPATPPASADAAVPVTTGNQTVEGVRVSGDRRWLVYDSDLGGSSDIYRLPLTGGEPERLTADTLDEFRGAISPDGREMAYHAFRAGTRDVFLLPLDGGPVRRLTASSGQGLSMANWSPDGSALTMFDLTTGHVYVMRRDASGRWRPPRFVARDGWRPEWSADGRAVVFVSPADGRIGTVSADSGAQRDLYVPGPGDPRAELAIYSRDGREIYFKSHDAQGHASFWSLPASGGRPRLLARLDDPARTSNRFEFATDGERFYFTVEDRQSDIWVAELHGR